MDLNEKARNIIENAIAGLLNMGMTPEGVAELLAVQGVIRTDNMKFLHELRQFVDESIEGLGEPEHSGETLQ
jgi:hypothetical protein